MTMKKTMMTISVILAGAFLGLMVFFAVTTKAAQPTSRNPYNLPDLSTDDLIIAYHKNINDAFNAYIKLMMNDLVDVASGRSDGRNGKPAKQDGTPFTASDCLDPTNANNYSTFCVAVNLLGGDVDQCSVITDDKKTDDYKKFCSLQDNALALKGYLNYKAALDKKTGGIFDTAKAQISYVETMVCLYGFDARSFPVSEPITCDPNKIAELQQQAQNLEQGQKASDLNINQNRISKEETTSKAALDQTLATYDQLRVAWQMHKKYMQVYQDLTTYRDKIVDIRHQTDLFPSKFLDMTTTKCN